MSCYGLDVIPPPRRQNGEPELEPSEEFPILYRLLTAPKTTTSGNIDSIYRSTSASSILSYSSIITTTSKRQNETQYEADSSAYTDEEDGISSNSSSGCGSSSDSCDFGSEEDCTSEDGHHLQHRRRHPIKNHQITIKKHRPVNSKHQNEDDADIYPTSTTTFDIEREEIEGESLNRDRRKENYRITHLKRTHDKIILSSSNNNSSSTDNDSCSSTSSDNNCISNRKQKRLQS